MFEYPTQVGVDGLQSLHGSDLDLIEIFDLLNVNTNGCQFGLNRLAVG